MVYIVLSHLFNLIISQAQLAQLQRVCGSVHSAKVEPDILSATNSQAALSSSSSRTTTRLLLSGPSRAPMSDVNDQAIRTCLARLDDWQNYDVFSLAELSMGRPLLFTGYAVFLRYGMGE